MKCLFLFKQFNLNIPWEYSCYTGKLNFQLEYNNTNKFEFDCLDSINLPYHHWYGWISFLFDSISNNLFTCNTKTIYSFYQLSFKSINFYSTKISRLIVYLNRVFRFNSLFIVTVHKFCFWKIHFKLPEAEDQWGSMNYLWRNQIIGYN